MGDIKLSRQQGMIAAYLNFVAIVLALVIAFILTTLMVGLYGEDFSRDVCYSKGK